jgi:hypothetical protein
MGKDTRARKKKKGTDHRVVEGEMRDNEGHVRCHSRIRLQ